MLQEFRLQRANRARPVTQRHARPGFPPRSRHIDSFAPAQSVSRPAHLSRPLPSGSALAQRRKPRRQRQSSRSRCDCAGNCRRPPSRPRAIRRNRLRSEAVTTPTRRNLLSNKPNSSAWSGQRSVLLRPKGVAFAFRTVVCDRCRDRSREMLHVPTGNAFPAERSQLGFPGKKC